MKEISKYDLKRLKPYEAVGKVCVELTDWRTGKVIQREQGKNMVFPDTLYSAGNWINNMSSIYLALNNNDTPININMPYLLGEIIGYGQPNQESSGNYRGSYNYAEQVIAQKTLESVRWKFRYDFSSPQAIGTIKNIGLTYQYSMYNVGTTDSFSVLSTLSNAYIYTCDGRYSYVCSTAGVITKYDNLVGSSSGIDVSAIVGSNAGEKKVVGYAPSTGLYYVYVYSTTPENRKMYVFTDATFSINSAIYNMSNCTYNPSYYTMYVYGDKAYILGYNLLAKVDFVNNLEYTTQSAAYEPAIVGTVQWRYSNTMGYDKYIFILGNVVSHGCIYDMSSEEVVGFMLSAYNNSSYQIYSAIKHPITANFIPTLAYSTLYHNCARTAKVLDTPVEKTSANGLTATYELEVFWDL